MVASLDYSQRLDLDNDSLLVRGRTFVFFRPRVFVGELVYVRIRPLMGLPYNPALDDDAVVHVRLVGYGD